ncbi:DEAD/DEAH box helicase [Paraburkholderia fungorum]|uniref:DEAD/DEAH box helicase n=1 Tax=Paraburkholderia fungorum TaxID=134537 RepID=UPI00248D953B|nr:DEAD/DEAH box helicase [Paraburkholderia fungorum]
MIFAELHQLDRPVVHLERNYETNLGAWARIQEAMGRGVVGGDQNRIEIRVDVFLAELDTVREARNVFGENVELGENLSAQLRSLVADRKARESVLSGTVVEVEHLQHELNSAGFFRELKSFQVRNLARISQLPHGADFSVPGAGKTTVALANFSVMRLRGIVKRALVVAPVSAFEAWQEDSRNSIAPSPRVIVHRGVGTVIPANTDILLTNYNRVVADYDQIRKYVSDTATHVILDEAHRVKRGSSGVHGRAVLDLAYAAKRRDVLTGTPAPQSAHDLIALICFLYPGQDRHILPERAYDERIGRDHDVLSETSAAIKKYFVRTTKSELELPETKFLIERRPMGDLQKAIYSALIGQYKASFKLETSGRRELDRLGRIMMYLLEAATNPMLLTAGSDNGDDPAFTHPPIELDGNERLLDLIASYNRHETPWKYELVRATVVEAAKNRQKILIWSSFVRNLKALARYLADFNPAIVHGGVPSVEEPAPEGTLSRERELNRFRHDSNCTVLLANPAACGEGVSLHHWCHHAIYLDRTFNAGQFLQSQDRIHRLGLEKGTLTKFTLLISEGTIDENVDGRLADKVRALSELMGDPALVRLALPDPDDAMAVGSEPPAEDDLQSVLAHVIDAS